MFERITAVLPFAFALAAGAVIPFQASANSALGRTLGNPLLAAVVSLTISLAVILPVALATRSPMATVATALRGPWWMLMGGVFGAVYIAGAVLLPPRLGASGFIIGVIAGQMLASLVVDQFGLFGLEPKPLTFAKLLGVALIAAGIFVMQRPVPAQAANVTASTPLHVNEK
ncbi:DMT family transporter [Paraburkholderia bannensis]|uniref:DMT family transporter n=1 Tax=Paraburkholderia bannensis TaxID=765414 RepID=UPI002AB01108|nr:DMT family transporter [Paraburkholderia bannensis]